MIFKKKTLIDTCIHIFEYQFNQDKFKSIFDKDRIKAEKVNKIYNYLKDHKTLIIINKKIIEEIKYICNKKDLFYDKTQLIEICKEFPGLEYNLKDINIIKKWNKKIKNPDYKFDEDDMLIYLLAKKLNTEIIITDNKKDFIRCKEIYKTHNLNSKDIIIWNIDDTLKRLNIN